MKLLNLVRPDRAYFGLKDFQQFTLIKDMCRTFFMPVQILGCDIVRERDGLAMSSRNLLLSPCRSAIGRTFNQLLANAVDDERARQELRAAGMQVAYVETVHGRRCGAWFGEGDQAVRLIDNMAVTCC